MSDREEMLARIRAAVRAGGDDVPPVPRAYPTTGRHAPGSAEVTALLVDRLLDYRAQVRRCSREEVPAAVAQWVRGAAVVVPPGLDPELLQACRAAAGSVVTDGRPGPLAAADLDRADVVVTGAAVAIAATGTIVLDAGPGQGRRILSLIPDRHVVVLTADAVVETVPEGIARLTPTAPLTLISGPSATSDIELQRVEGVHGPRTLQVVLID